MGMVMSFMGKGLPMSSTQMPNYVMGSLYKQFVDKNIKTFDEFHVAVLEIFNTFNSSLPGKHYDVPSRKDIEAGYKLDESTLIIGLATPPAAMAAKRAGENVPQLGFIKAIPDVIFVPSATILALVSAKLTKRMLQGSPAAS
ncbi:CALCIUM ION-BINDING PROTEIN [Salix viminalis]|uniref:CALCIUM ION-BINDING PROTEIN n=1 Tax=Salix viminalis TaxID=40686 RepID=A0A9Q0NYI5_SALVM|nr:CALCIUM ION-BINDING PROTEIN [Salix viminalis]